MKKYFQFLFFVSVCSFLCLNTTGCGLWKKPWKNPWRNANSHPKYGKELPDPPFYSGRSQDELVDQAAALRKTAPYSVQDSYVETEETKPWYKRPLLMSSKAAKIDAHLGD